MGTAEFKTVLVRTLIDRKWYCHGWLLSGLSVLWMLSIVAEPLAAQTPYPMLMSLKPVAATVGQSSEHTVKSRYSLHGAYQILVDGTGVTAEVVDPRATEEGKDGKTPNLQDLKISFTVDEDAVPGVRDFRIATPRGVSTLGQVVISRGKVTYESDKNNTREEATEVTVPGTLCGAIERAEDVDHFRFEVTEGSKLVFRVRCMTLQDKIHDLQQHADPIITLRNAAGSTVNAADNNEAGDPLLAHTFDRAGEYFLEIRDVRFQGNQYWQYAIEVSDAPFATTVFPLALNPGASTAVEVMGPLIPEKSRSQVTIEQDAELGPLQIPLNLDGERSNPVTILASRLPLQTESQYDNDTIQSAQPIEVPSGVNGGLDRKGDKDHFAFEAKKGERFSFEVFARRLRSNVDPHLRILNDQGRQLQLNDDLRVGKRLFSDSAIENWSAPADGRYLVEMRDLHHRGGRDFPYFVAITRSTPHFELFADTDKTQLTPGTSGVIFVRVVRKNGFDGAIQLAVENLPEGVTATCGRILPGKGQDGCIVLTASEDAALSVANIRIQGTATHEDKTLSTGAKVYQETYQPGGGRGHWPSSMHTVAVGAPNDVRGIELSSYEIRIKPGESQKIGVKIHRAEGFKQNLTLDVAYRHLNSVYGNSLPEGVTLDANASKTLLTSGASEGHIVLKASEKAPAVESQQIAVMANVSINFVMKATYSSRPVFITVE